ncbi:unnamed protein product [Arctia plantaginis]|uniref:Uncharacterized protein n=1 Tax=Arctia plantaginis TaxID=874455 RepID=A0A8S0YYX5_ARCPL|nr:unnamed protein product [Arctia plantaginis]
MEGLNAKVGSDNTDCERYIGNMQRKWRAIDHIAIGPRYSTSVTEGALILTATTTCSKAKDLMSQKSDTCTRFKFELRNRFSIFNTNEGSMDDEWNRKPGRK